ncbi:MAG: TolC family protein [Bryobacteraceae bacterium]|jgi:outer membrane protein TolC
MRTLSTSTGGAGFSLPTPTGGRILSRILTAAALAGALAAQAPLPIAPTRPQGLPFVRSYQPVTVPPLRLTGSGRLRGMIQAGNLHLTARDAIALALESSLDLEIARYSLVMADWAVERAESGGALRGVTGASSESVTLGSGQGVAGSQGGGGTVGTSGSSTVAGAALIQQIGPVTPQLDPVLSTTDAFSHQTSPQFVVVQSGVYALVDDARSYNWQVSAGLLTGGTARVAYSDSYLNETVPTDVLNPTSFTSLGISLSQNLLRGFGQRVNGRFIRISRRQVGGAGQAFRQRLMAVVSGVLNAYWDLSLAANDLQYKQRNRDVAAQFLADTRRQIAVGAAPAVDRINAESAAAAAEQALVVARNSVAVRQNALKDYLSFRAVADDQLAGAQIVAIDPLNVPEIDDLPSLHELIASAIRQRPEVALANLSVDLAGIAAEGTANGVLPNLGVSASATNYGQAGQAVPGTTPAPYFVGGVGNALAQTFRRNFPNQSAGASYSEHLWNTQAQADHAINVLSQRQAELTAERTRHDLAVNISSQVLALEQARARYKAATESRGLIERLLQGEEKKWVAGTSTISTVVAARRDLANAQSAELAAAAAYVHGRIALDQELGRTLEVNQVSVEDTLAK